jgi:hypothetical protein
LSRSISELNLCEKAFLPGASVTLAAPPKTFIRFQLTIGPLACHFSLHLLLTLRACFGKLPHKSTLCPKSHLLKGLFGQSLFSSRKETVKQTPLRTAQVYK